MRVKRVQEEITTVNGGSLPCNFSGKAEIVYKKNIYTVGYEVEFSLCSLPDYWGETDFYVYIDPIDIKKIPKEVRKRVVSSIRRSVSAEYEIYDI